MLEACLNLLATLVAATVLFVACYMLVRVAFKAAEVYRAARDYLCPPPKRYRVLWRSRTGDPPWWLKWKRGGGDLFTTTVEAANPDDAMGQVEAAYTAAPGYDHHRPEFVRVAEVLTPLGDE